MNVHKPRNDSFTVFKTSRFIEFNETEFFSFHEEKICDSIAYFDLPFYIAYLDSEYALPCLIGLSKFLESHIFHQSELW